MLQIRKLLCLLYWQDQLGAGMQGAEDDYDRAVSSPSGPGQREQRPRTTSEERAYVARLNELIRIANVSSKLTQKDIVNALFSAEFNPSTGHLSRCLNPENPTLVPASWARDLHEHLAGKAYPGSGSEEVADELDVLRRNAVLARPKTRQAKELRDGLTAAIESIDAHKAEIAEARTRAVEAERKLAAAQAAERKVQDLEFELESAISSLRDHEAENARLNELVRHLHVQIDELTDQLRRHDLKMDGDAALAMILLTTATGESASTETADSLDGWWTGLDLPRPRDGEGAIRLRLRAAREHGNLQAMTFDPDVWNADSLRPTMNLRYIAASYAYMYATAMQEISAMYRHMLTMARIAPLAASRFIYAGMYNDFERHKTRTGRMLRQLAEHEPKLTASLLRQAYSRSPERTQLVCEAAGIPVPPDYVTPSLLSDLERLRQL